MNIKFIILGLLFLFTLVTGFLLHRLGKPFNSLVFNIHKLIALVLIIFLVIIIWNLLKSSGINITFIILIVLLILSVIALFVSGALMSIGKPENIQNLMFILHNLVAILIVIFTAILIYFLIKK